jgi:DNA-binding NtrC family response regulator
MKHCVLLVDDEPNILDALSRALRKESYVVRCATRADEALNILRTESVDVVVSDQDMPGTVGTTFLARVLAEFPNTIRFMLTGKASLETAIAAINHGAVSRFFTKPCSPVDLMYTIRQALQQRELLTKTRGLLRKVKSQGQLLRDLETDHPGISAVRRDATGTILMDDVPGGYEEILREIDHELEEEPVRPE